MPYLPRPLGIARISFPEETKAWPKIDVELNLEEVALDDRILI
jgi:hypothetical protein